jgi:hypothetical protein
MPRLDRQLALFGSLLAAAGVLGFFSPKLAFFVLLGACGGAAVRLVPRAAAAARRRQREIEALRPEPRAVRPRHRWLLALGALALAGSGLALGLTFFSFGTKSLTAPSTATAPAPPPPNPFDVTQPVLFHGAARYDGREQRWRVLNEFRFSPKAIRAVATDLNGGRPVGAARGRRLVDRYLIAHGWNRSRPTGETAVYSRTAMQSGRLRRWPLHQTMRVGLRTFIPSVTNPLIAASSNSQLLIYAPKHLVDGTFPRLRTRQDMYNGREQITVVLDTGEDEPPSEVTVRAVSSLGRNAFVSNVYDFVSERWFGWFVGIVSFAGGLTWKRLKGLARRRRRRARHRTRRRKPGTSDSKS